MLVILLTIALINNQIKNSSQINIMFLFLIIVSITQYIGLNLKLWYLSQLL